MRLVGRPPISHGLLFHRQRRIFWLRHMSYDVYSAGSRLVLANWHAAHGVRSDLFEDAVRAALAEEVGVPSRN